MPNNHQEAKESRHCTIDSRPHVQEPRPHTRPNQSDPNL